MNFIKKIVYKSLYSSACSSFFKTIFKYISKPYESYIFVISTGRSGTGTLFEIFNTIEDTVAYHEPKPIMNDTLMIDNNNNNSTKAKEIFFKVKSNIIQYDNIFKKNKNYMESNHMFIKSFHEFAYDLYKNKLKVIYLHRNPILVAKSFYEIGSIPGTNKGNKWLLDYKAKNNLLQLKNELENDYKHDYYKCLWYCYEIEKRANKFQKEHSDLKFIKIDTEELNNAKTVENLLNFLNCKFNDKILNKTVGKKFNQKSKNKKNVLDIQECENMNKQFISLIQEYEIKDKNSL